MSDTASPARVTKQILVAVTVEADTTDELPDDETVIAYVDGSVAGDLLVGNGSRYVIASATAPA